MSATFPSFVLSKDNRSYLLIAAVAAILQIIIFKLLYPYADFFSDSYSYIYAAATGTDVNIWPVGYSKFLWFFRQETTSDTTLVVFQYLFLQTITLYFFFTLLYFYAPSKRIRYIIFGCFFFNPLMLYLSNYISSDALFLALSLLWVIQLLWMLHQPRWYQIFIHAFLIIALFTLRYNAMYYPFITAFVLLLSRQQWIWKVTGILLPLLFIFLFVQHTRKVADVMTGTPQFSIFGGWQLANNALYMYPYITVKGQPPAECREFDQVVQTYFRNIPEEGKSISPRDGAFYIKYSKAPLKQYVATHINPEKDSTNGIYSWGAVAPIYGSYGKFLMLEHPIAFARYFLLPNTINYFLPPLEKLEVYNLGEDRVSGMAVKWFHYPGNKVTAISWDAQGIILLLFPAIFLSLNFFFCWTLVLWIRSAHGRKADPVFKYALIIITTLLIVNAAFSILASPIVFRYQVFPMLLCFSFVLLMTDKMNTSSPVSRPGS
ncbi:hypothetical protein [Chitinophaga arvensicola]|uniref:Dolichyl-phosphate-mannose-protein mannosyltransferase n=1 Tax=Chitinophaga arvensicola TaxID=29529 RepID=A0A1I0RP87_9BACT|nr:hypothetical protein [Chitinophaga arvensicola]SEW43141.1 hypothetical protein SAMN04488122_3181 [Chitinophaga arvensicola]